MHVMCITNQKEHNLKESRLILFPMEKNAHIGGWWYSVEPRSENLVVRNFLYREFSKNKNGNKGTIIYLLDLTPSKNLIQTITLKQSVASNNDAMGQKTLNSCSITKVCHFCALTVCNTTSYMYFI